MELIVLDASFSEIGTIEIFESFQWIRKYYEYGQFELTTSLKHFSMLDQGKYIFRKSRDNLAIIESVKMTLDSKNEVMVKASGRFFECILEDRAYAGSVTKTGTRKQICETVINENYITPTDASRKVSCIDLGTSYDDGEQSSLELNNDVIGDNLYAMLKEKNESIQFTYDYLNNRMIFKIWKGLDRTESQTENSWALFSDTTSTLADSEYQRDISDYKNFAYVTDGNGKTVTVDQVRVGEDRKEIVVSSNESTDSEMIAKGKNELSKYAQIETFDGKAISSDNMQYLRDFDLGDLVTVINTKVGKTADIRITEIREIYEDGEIVIEPKFGEDAINITKLIEREARK